MSFDDSSEALHIVVVNDEEQYSIWPDAKEVPSGWKSIGEKGDKQFCLDRIKELWVDMRPISLRRQMI